MTTIGILKMQELFVVSLVLHMQSDQLLDQCLVCHQCHFGWTMFDATAVNTHLMPVVTVDGV